jgi:outer membrane protein OmpA-like peptidoglycan-associated protein
MKRIAARGASWRIMGAAALLTGLSLATTRSPAQAQVVWDTVGFRGGSVGVHLLAGGFGGRFDLQGGPASDVLGARAGVGLGEVLQLTGFYWRSVDTDVRELLADRAYGAEARLALNAGFGLAPFVSAGAGRLDYAGLPQQTAAIAGAGLMLPLGPLLFSATAHDYILGVTGLGGDGIEDVTHNWLFSAGLTFGLGRGRRPEPILVQRPATQPPPRAATATPATADPAAAQAGVRSYHSDRTIEVPIPLEGSITLRYGPEPAITVTAADVLSAEAPLGFVTPPGQVPGASPAAATAMGQDAALQTWLRQAIDSEVAAQLRMYGATTPAGFADPGVQRAAADRALANVLLRLETMEVQRLNALRNEVSRALAAQSLQIRNEINRLETRITGTPAPVQSPFAVAPPTPAPTLPAGPPQPVPPAAGPASPVVPSPISPPAAGVPAPRPAETVWAPERAPLADGHEAAEVRIALAEMAIRHPRALVTAETPRGPAIVLTDIAFPSGAALLSEEARVALSDIASVLRRFDGRNIYVQGHTDSAGAELQNQRLSDLRAETVRSMLAREGLDPSRLFSYGFGQGRPIADNVTAAGRALNRRVEIVIGEARAGLDVLVALEEPAR